MAKKEDKHEALIIYQELGGGHPINLVGDRVVVSKDSPIHDKVAKAFEELKKKLPKQ